MCLHGTDDSRSARRADRLRPAAGHSARGAGRSRPPRTADQGGLRRQESADVAEAERAGALAGDRRQRRSAHRGGSMTTTSAETPTAAVTLKSRHLLGIAGLDADEITLILDTAEAMKEIGGRRDQESADAARPDGREPVLRAEHADADVVRDCREAPERRHARASRPPTSSVDQGRDAARHGAEPRSDVARHDRHAPCLVGRCRTCSRASAARRIINAGDGMHEHPTQALLDAFTIREHKGRLAGLQGRHRRRSAAQPRAAVERRCC